MRVMAFASQKGGSGKTTPAGHIAVQAERAGATVDLVENLDKSLVFVLNGATPRAHITAEAAIALSQHGTVAPVTIHHHTEFASSMIDGRTVMEIAGNQRSVDEIAQLWTYSRRSPGSLHAGTRIATLLPRPGQGGRMSALKPASLTSGLLTRKRMASPSATPPSRANMVESIQTQPSPLDQMPPSPATHLNRTLQSLFTQATNEYVERHAPEMSDTIAVLRIRERGEHPGNKNRRMANGSRDKREG